MEASVSFVDELSPHLMLCRGQNRGSEPRQHTQEMYHKKRGEADWALLLSAQTVSEIVHSACTASSTTTAYRRHHGSARSKSVSLNQMLKYVRIGLFVCHTLRTFVEAAYQSGGCAQLLQTTARSAVCPKKP